MASPENITSRQLDLARRALWHQDGSALRTLDDAREWLDTAGLVPFYPHPQFATPAPSFAEAVLGRPENGWVPEPVKATALQDVDDSDAEEDGLDENPGEDEDDEDEQSDKDDELEEDDDEPMDEAEIDASASDDEIMLSDDDEFNEDEGDEIAEEDRIRAQGDPIPNNLNEAEITAAPEPAPEPVNGFSPEERATVQRTLARLVADGSAVPLNLLGSTTGEPDYVCSAQAFSFVYTLRGDKTWKQEPAQTGSMRVSPLAAKAYEILKEKGAQAPHELAQELGQGIVDSAVLRALSELWAIQRVLPVPDTEGKPAKWEVMTGRFLRHLKAGANAGQPTALSALLSLYLAQVVAATGDEMEIFLSPLVARSRVREVVHGLSATQQLDTFVIDGKTLLHIAGDLPDFAVDDTPAIAAAPQRSRYERDDRMAADAERAARGPSSRDSRPERKSSYPVRKPAGARAEGERGSRPGGPRFGNTRPGGSRPGGPRPGGARFGGGEGRPSFPRRSEGAPDRERRPFVRRDADAPASGGGEPNRFARPWDDDRKPAVEGQGSERAAGGNFDRPAGGSADRPERFARSDRDSRPAGGSRPAYGRPSGDRGGSGPEERRPGGDRKPFGDRKSFGDRKPFTPREGGERRPYTPRDASGGGRTFSERKPFTPREGALGGERRPYAPRDGGERRPFTPRDSAPSGERRPFSDRKPFGDRKPFTPREGGERRPYTPREGAPSGGERRPFAPREGGERRPYVRRDGAEGSERKPYGDRKPFVPREGGGSGERRPFTPREGSGGERRPFTPREGAGERRPFTPREGSGERRPYGDRKPMGGPRKSFGAGAGGERKSFDGPRPPYGGSNSTRGERPSRDRFSGEPGESRPAFQSGAHSAGPGGAKFGGSSFGKGAPGKFGKPGFSPSRKGSGSGPGRGGAPK